MEYKTVIAGPFEVNTYIVWDDKSQDKKGFIIDPAGEKILIEQVIKENNIKPQFILNTHCHIDHVALDNYFKDKLHIHLYAHKEENLLLKNLKTQGAYLGIDFSEQIIIDRYLKENEIIKVGSINIKAIFTPGHSPGSMSFLVDSTYLFSGDTIFKESIGRTDLLGGDSKKIIDSIKNKIFLLDENIIILPGHGEKSTIGYEKTNNFYVAA
ncbi:MAG: MBL fold metallo-hydrolase [Candidatus Omnitrophica bacterium]|jgi:glyoxylase-like metal-dependent hydrolase (beta-lactamase superfamily II)|nr:MBL fold metallo-hydrolase [Candidatus Omnitrophota bacterium]